ncbi:MAG TPA: hypothetical protein VJ736_02955 [Actinomycetota bacterium]|nr:hypothetical protein [Actinomycetota bacterium]
MSCDDVRAHLASWGADSISYQQRHSEFLGPSRDFGRGTRAIPEDEVHALDEITARSDPPIRRGRFRRSHASCRPGGRFVFSGATPFTWVTWPMVDGPPGRMLERPYVGVAGCDGTRTSLGRYQLPYGEWIRSFRANGLLLDDLIELRPPVDAETAFANYVTLESARDLPAEHISKARKETA